MFALDRILFLVRVARFLPLQLTVGPSRRRPVYIRVGTFLALNVAAGCFLFISTARADSGQKGRCMPIRKAAHACGHQPHCHPRRRWSPRLRPTSHRVPQRMSVAAPFHVVPGPTRTKAALPWAPSARNAFMVAVYDNGTRTDDEDERGGGGVGRTTSLQCVLCLGRFGDQVPRCVRIL